MPAALAKPGAFGGEPDQRHEQHARFQRCGIGPGLQQSERTGLEIAFAKRVAELSEVHRRVAVGEAGQGEIVPLFEEEFGIGCRGRFIGIGAVQADHGTFGDQFEQRRGRAHEHQRAHVFR